MLMKLMFSSEDGGLMLLALGTVFYLTMSILTPSQKRRRGMLTKIRSLATIAWQQVSQAGRQVIGKP